MSASSGPNLVTPGLTFSMDSANSKGINSSSCVGYNNATQLVKNLISTLDVTSSSSTIRLGNLAYYTAFAIDYPESSFGGSAASRQGITQGFNVTSGGKTYDASRSLHLWVWDEDSSSWVPDSFFTGERLNGHCYDSYLGTASVNLWVNDFNKITSTYKNITVIVMGSHRDSNHTQEQYTILRDLGAPGNVDSIIGFSSPEWILIGKPGLGPDNGAWAFQNYSVNPTQVAHMNFGIPLKGNINNYLNFDGSNDYISLPNTQIIGSSAGTVSAIIKIPSAQSDYDCIFTCETGPDWNNLRTWMSMYGANQIRFTVSNGSSSTQNGCISSALLYNTTYHVTGTYDGSTVKIYLNGVLNASLSSSIVPGTFTPSMVRIGHHYGTRYFGGAIYSLNTYTRALTAIEVQQNFNATRSRYGI